MNGFELPYFGLINGADKRISVVEVAEHKMSMDLNLDNEILTSDQQHQLKHFLENLEAHLLKTRQFIDEYYDEDDEENDLRFYLNFHKEEALDEMEEALNVNPAAADLDLQLIAKLKPVRVGIYPKVHDFFAIFDYSFGDEFTNYVLVLRTDAEGEILSVDVES